MKYNLVITKRAMIDEMETYHYYEDIRPGLGDRFIESVENRYAALLEHPDYYSYSDSNKIIRDVAIDGFPYLIIYEISGNSVIIFAIHNTYNAPSFNMRTWWGRK